MPGSFMGGSGMSPEMMGMKFVAGPEGTMMPMPGGTFDPSGFMMPDKIFDPSNIVDPSAFVPHFDPCADLGQCGASTTIINLTPYEIFWNGGYIQDLLMVLKNRVDQAGGMDTYWQNAYFETGSYSGSYTGGHSQLSSSISLNMSSITSAGNMSPVTVQFQYQDSAHTESGTAVCNNLNCTEN